MMTSCIYISKELKEYTSGKGGGGARKLVIWRSGSDDPDASIGLRKPWFFRWWNGWVIGGGDLTRSRTWSSVLADEVTEATLFTSGLDAEAVFLLFLDGGALRMFTAQKSFVSDKRDAKTTNKEK